MNDTRAEFWIGACARKEQADQFVGMRAGYLALEISVEFLARGRAGMPMLEVESSHSPITTLRVMFALADRAAKTYPFTQRALPGRVWKRYAGETAWPENFRC